MNNLNLKNIRITLAVLFAIIIIGNCKTASIDTDIITTPEGAAIKFKGKEIGSSPITIQVSDVGDLLKITAKYVSKNVIETRIRFLSPLKAVVTFRFGDDPSTVAKALGLKKVLIFEYSEHTAFDTDKYDLKSEFMPLLSKQAGLLKNYFSSVPVYICGHTDDTGDKDYNLMLSLKRAQTVADFLVSLKVNKKRLNIRGFGKDYPIASNELKGGRAINRRTEIVLS
jgi:outer membrane protein OmpA-like peptidoglycan-associated protein